MRLMLFPVLVAVFLAGTSYAMDWSKLNNPVYSKDNWSVKDACMIYNEKNNTYYLFFSAFYFDDGKERSHVVGVKTRDFTTFSEPVFNIDGRQMGWLGFCSPDITMFGGKYYLTYNSWGDKPGKPNQLFYGVSTDLENWEHFKPLAHNLTQGVRAIDSAIAFANGRVYLAWKDRVKIDGKNIDRVRIAVGDSIDSNFKYVGEGIASLAMPNGKENGNIHENFRFFRVGDKWHILTTDYRPDIHSPYIYKMAGDGCGDADWLDWNGGRQLKIPQESFNTDHIANAAFITRLSTSDPHWYLLYAGRTEGESHARRGDNKLGLARSIDMIKWTAPGK